MKKIFFLPLLFFSLSSLAQIKYEPGYFVNDLGKRKEVLILNRDWKNTPTTFTWRSTQDSPAEASGLDEVREFGINGGNRFVRFMAPIDPSPQGLEHLGLDPSPTFVEEMVFLRQLVDGKLSLYVYEAGPVQQFFYRTEGEDLEPLIFKKYRDQDRLLTNSRFRQQLFQDLNCGGLSTEAVRQIDYREKDLVPYFKNYNTCIGSQYTIIDEKDRKLDLRLHIKAGINLSSMDILSGMSAAGKNITFDPVPRIGAETEVILPFNHNKWSLFLEGTYSSLKRTEHSHETQNLPTHEAALTLLEHQYFSVAQGAKFSFYLPGPIRIAVGAGPVFDLPLKSRIIFDRGRYYDLRPELNSLSTGLYFRFLVGIIYSDRISLEVSYETPRTQKGFRSVGSNYVLDWRSEMSNLGITLGYRFF